MKIDFISRKLTIKLFLLVLVALLLPILLLVYFLQPAENTADYTKVIVFVSLILAAYGIASIYFLTNFLKGIKALQIITANLKAGKRNGIGNTGNVGDLRPVIETIAEIHNITQHHISFAEQIKSGNLNAAFNNSRQDSDRLGNALIGIKETLITIRQEEEQRKWMAESLARFVEILQSANSLKTLSNSVIINLVRTINANQGAIFIVSEENEQEVLDMQACYAFDRSKHMMQRVVPGQGLIGQAYLERQTVYLKDVPEKFVRITSGLGEANPRFILIVPLKMNDHIVGIIELASFKAFSEHVISFVEKIGETIAHAVSSFRVSENTKRLLDESNSQTEALRAQEEELRQNQEELQATQEAITRKYDMLFKQLSELNHQSKFDQLKSITSTKKRNIEYYFDIIRNQILTFAENSMVIDAVKNFRPAFYKLELNTPDEMMKIRESVTSYYLSEFMPRLNINVSLDMKLEEYVPKDIRTLLLQKLFIADNPHPTGSKSLLNDAQDGSEYSKIHARYHPIFRSFLEKFGYYDIFLIDAHSGDMLYSVFKEVDFATNLFDGAYNKTNFGEVVKQAVASKDKGFVRLIDFEPYDPSYHAPASFIASVVYDGDEKVGILVFQMPINKINQILTGNNKWREDGLGETGETFIVGEDFKLRSISRQLIEDLEGHLSDLKKLNYSTATLQQMRKMQTSILTEEVKTAGIADALNGVTGTSLESDTKNEQLLSAYSPVSIPDVHWVIVSTMKEAEASQTIKNLRDENF